MALAPGTRLGVYEVTAQIGDGGMGQVYRATATTLGRQVAIKILPDTFASDPERLARFEREAKTHCRRSSTSSTGSSRPTAGGWRTSPTVRDHSKFTSGPPNVGGGQRQVSTAGGRQPLWARSGQELFYLSGTNALLRVLVEASGTTWNNGTPMKLLEGHYVSGGGTLGRTYDVSADGLRFLKIKAPGTDASAAPPALIVVQHWDEELKRLVPAK